MPRHVADRLRRPGGTRVSVPFARNRRPTRGEHAFHLACEVQRLRANMQKHRAWWVSQLGQLRGELEAVRLYCTDGVGRAQGESDTIDDLRERARGPELFRRFPGPPPRPVDTRYMVVDLLETAEALWEHGLLPPGDCNSPGCANLFVPLERDQVRCRPECGQADRKREARAKKRKADEALATANKERRERAALS